MSIALKSLYRSIREFEWIISLIAIFGGGTGLGGWQYAETSNMPLAITAGLVVITCLSILWVYIAKPKLEAWESSDDRSDSERILPFVRQCFDTIGLTHKLTDVKEGGQIAVGTTDAGIKITAGVHPKYPNYLHIAGAVSLAGELMPRLNSLPQRDANVVVQELRLEIARAKILYELDMSKGLVSIQKRIPLANAFSEPDILDAILEIETGMTLVVDRLHVSLSRLDSKTDDSRAVVSSQSDRDTLVDPPQSAEG